MAAAFRVSYRGPNGICPDAVVTFESPDGEDVATLAARIKAVLVTARGGCWSESQVTLLRIEYVGVWFKNA